MYVGSCRDMMTQVRAPRSAFIDYPLGRPCGRPHDVDLQTRILKDVLNILATADKPGMLLDLEYDWGSPFGWQDFMDDMQQMLAEEEQQVQEWKPK